MNPPDYYQTIAEIGIGLAGFSGLIVALRKRSGPLSDVLKFRMTVLFGLSFGAMFLAVLPFGLRDFGLEVASGWRILCAGMAAYSVLFIYWWVTASKRIAEQVPEIFSRRAFTTMSTGHVIVLGLLVGAATDLLEGRQSGVYGLGLTWYLVHASQQFVRMLFIQPQASGDPDP